MRPYIVYIHTNKVNGKIYVGITCRTPAKRWGKDGKKYEECPRFYRAIKKYGWDNFSHDIVMEGLSHDDACEMEKLLISQ